MTSDVAHIRTVAQGRKIEGKVATKNALNESCLIVHCKSDVLDTHGDEEHDGIECVGLQCY